MEKKSTHWNIQLSKRKVKYTLISVFILTLLTLLALPMYCDYTDRARISEMILLMSSAKVGVTEAIESNDGLQPIDPSKIQHSVEIGKYRDMKTTDGYEVYIEYFEISSTGQITMLVSGLSAYIQLTPVIENGEVKAWHCYGRPHKNMPGICRNEKLITSQGSNTPAAQDKH